MPKQDTHSLRIFCLCGQKMKVTPEMLGRTGACVACGRSIFIPGESDLPAGTREIHLSDHPQWVQPDALPAMLLEADEDDTLGPIDILEPLRILSSAVYGLRRDLAAMKDEQSDSERAPLERYLLRAQEERASLDMQMRERLTETNIELASTQKQVAEARVAVRVGRMSFEEYGSHIARLRSRRDWLERRRQNLEGWLDTRDPFTAGGYVEVPLHRLAQHHFRLSLPAEPEDPDALLARHLETLRQGLIQRDAAERLYVALDANRGGDGRSAADREARAQCRADRRRAANMVAFARDRLAQCESDLQADLATVENHLHGIQVQAGPAAREKRAAARARSLEKERTQLQRKQALVAAALAANIASDVPRTPRAAKAKKPLVTSAGAGDTWFALLAAVAIGVAVFLPLGDGLTPARAFVRMRMEDASGLWLILGPLLLAVMVGAAAFLPWRGVRGGAFCILWLAGSLISAGYVHEAAYNPSPLGEVLRDSVFLSPAGILYGIGLFFLALAAAAALRHLPASKFGLPVVFLAGVIGVAAIMTDVAGLLRSTPLVSHKIGAAQTSGATEVAVVVANAGRRTLLLKQETNTANAFHLTLERLTEQGQWAPAPSPAAVRVGGRPVSIAVGQTPDLAVPPGEDATLTYTVADGAYRWRLSNDWSGYDNSQTFAVGDAEAPAGPAGVRLATPIGPSPRFPGTSPQPDTEAESAPAPEEAEPSPAEAPAETPPDPPEEAEQAAPVRSVRLEDLPPERRIDVELLAIATAPGRGPRFSVAIYERDEPAERKTLELTDSLYGDWYLSEYNPDERAVVVSNDSELRVLRVTERTPLMAAPAGRRNRDIAPQPAPMPEPQVPIPPPAQ